MWLLGTRVQVNVASLMEQGQDCSWARKARVRGRGMEPHLGTAVGTEHVPEKVSSGPWPGERVGAARPSQEGGGPRTHRQPRCQGRGAVQASPPWPAPLLWQGRPRASRSASLPLGCLSRL